ncbi:hypothetical protein PR048_030211 [Dryococelus australis]|uniref:Uncharacterized protein n=1 Tax=Dryococelus australis TaxID=614101 RepID=A0ABQ9G8A8_9NEOP|nr:hypothetical protein PR048_030211 [Dryococelus australis]
MSSQPAGLPIDHLKGRGNCDTWKFVVQAYLEDLDLWDCLILLVDPSNYVHVQNTTTAKATWENLQKVFQGDEYVDQIVNTAHKLSTVGLKVSDEWTGVILLTGLPNKYEPMIMGIESSRIQVTGDSIKAKLLQDITW